MSVTSFSDVAGRAVISVETAESIGSVKGFHLDSQARSIVGIHIAGRGKHATVISWSRVTAFGDDTVMVGAAPSGSATEAPHDRAPASDDVGLTGSRVLTVDGDVVGEVTDVQFDTATGAIVGVATGRGAIEAERFRSLGSFALVVDPTRAAT